MGLTITVLGAKNSGKATLVQKMLHGTAASVQPSTQQFVYEHTNKNVWIINDLYKGHAVPHYIKHANIILYCVEFSSATDEKQIIEDLTTVRKYNHQTPIVLIGTKNDLYNDENRAYKTLNSILENLEITNFLDSCFDISAHQENDLTQFNNRIQKIIDQPKSRLEIALRIEEQKEEVPIPPLEEVTLPHEDAQPIVKTETLVLKPKLKLQLLVDASKQLPHGSLLHQSLTHFILVVSRLHLPLEQCNSLGQQTLLLINQLKTDNIIAKKAAILAFNNQCKIILKDQLPQVTKAYEHFVLAAIVTVLAFIIGFSLGCVFGLWAGPLALMAGIAAGSTAAVSLTAARANSN